MRMPLGYKILTLYIARQQLFADNVAFLKKCIGLYASTFDGLHRQCQKEFDQWRKR